jgi:tRNA threonylcarbamoyladenosine biosynthesis protein TsaB
MRGDSLLAARGGESSISHSAFLLDQIKAVLSEASVSLKEIEVLAVAAGPGSFTGLRIGLATTKSFAATLGLPCVGVPTLHAVARAAGESPSTFALLPAGRGEMYAQKLSVTSSGEVHPLDEPGHFRPESLLASVTSLGGLKWAGEGAHLLSEEIKRRALSQGISFQKVRADAPFGNNEWLLVSSDEVLASSVGKIALSHAPFKSGTSPQDLQAIYVRASDAEIKAQ